MADVFRDLLNSFVSDCVNGSSEPAPSTVRKVLCVDHPGGPFVIVMGVKPVVETECVVCRFTRQEKEAKEHYRKSIAWQRKPAQTQEEIETVGEAEIFRRFQKPTWDR